MNEPFEIPVTYKGEEVFFPAQLQPYGYVHRFVVDVFGQEVFFEPDEGRQNYRAIIAPENITKQVSLELLQAIAEAIEAILK